MSKRPYKLTVRIPNFMTGSKKWRRAMYEAVAKIQREGPVRYEKTDKLEVQIRFHLQGRKLTILDVDNRIKDVLDALQGFMKDKGKVHRLRPIIPNDNQIYRIVAEKRLPPKADRAALSMVVIRKYSNHPTTARSAREYRKHVPAGP